MALALIVALNVLSAVLPILAILRLLRRAFQDASARRAQIAERGDEKQLTFGDLDVLIARLAGEPFERVSAVLWDVGLIGAGVVIGATANIWSLFV